MEMVQEFVYFCEAIYEENPNSLLRLAFYEMMLWIKVNNEDKITELCDCIATNDDGDKPNFKGHQPNQPKLGSTGTVAGHEITGSVLTWTAHLLSKKRALQAEAEMMRGRTKLRLERCDWRTSSRRTISISIPMIVGIRSLLCRVGSNLALSYRECVSLPSIPSGTWYCKYCENMFQKEKFVEHNANAVAAGRIAGIDPLEQITKRCIRIVETTETDVGGCALCRGHGFSKSVFGPQTVILYDQCEKEYHIGCLKEHKMDDLQELPKGKWFCCMDCNRVHSALQNLVVSGEQKFQDSLLSIIKKKLEEKGSESSADLDIKWRLLSGQMASDDTRLLLSKAVSIFHFCFAGKQFKCSCGCSITRVSIHRTVMVGQSQAPLMHGNEYKKMRTWFVSSSIVLWLIRTRTTHICFFSSSISHSQPPTSISNPTSKPISDSQIYSLSSLFLDNPNKNSSFPKKSRSEIGFSASTKPPTCEFTESISQKKSIEQTHVIKVLLSQRNDPDSTLNYFKWAEKLRSFARGIVDPFCVLLCILVGSPNHHQIARNMLNRYVLGDSRPSSCVLVDHLVDCSKRFEFDSDSWVFNYLLNSYVRAGRFKDAFDCFDRMIESNIEPWVMCINVFLTALASFIKLDAANYSIAIRAVCRKPNSNVVCELLNEMTKMGWVPSVGTFACIIGACVKQGNMVDALKVKDKMVNSGKPMNLIVATSLMKGYYMAGDLDSALNLFDKIVRDGLEPNMVTYSFLIEGCFRGGKMEKAYELCTQMKLASIRPSVYIVNSLIRGFLGVHLWEEAFKHFDEAVECGIANVFTYNNMIC
ncbi:hypothetical protein ACSBR2_028952 [Camellia fascicularis]